MSMPSQESKRNVYTKPGEIVWVFGIGFGSFYNFSISCSECGIFCFSLILHFIKFDVNFPKE